MFFRTLYQLLIQSGWKIIQVGAIFSPTLKTLYKNRKIRWPKIKRSSDPNEKLLWMHCASLGEYEQGKSFLKAWRRKNPSDLILLSFFSNSGYEKVVPGDHVDYTVYLPWDTKKKVNQFLDHFHPDRAVFVKYEFWYNYLHQLNIRKIPTIFISLILDRDHFLFKNYATFLLHELRQSEHLFVQDEDTLQCLQKSGFENSSLAGDTRVDTVAELPQIHYEDPVVAKFVSRDLPVVIIGSAWEADIQLLSTLSTASLKQFHWIIVPHQIHDRFIRQIGKTFSALGVLIFSEQPKIEKEKVLVLDAIGHLPFLYRFAHWVYIGGGFGAGIHNTLEPAAYGKPVVFGPRYHNFKEAVTLLKEEAFYSIRHAEDLESVIKTLQDEKQYAVKSTSVKAYIQKNRNAVGFIMNKIEEF